MDAYLIPYFGSATWTYSPDGLINDANRIKGKYKGYSVYVDLSYEFTEFFDMSFGLRYNDDEKKFSQESLPDPGDSVLAYHVQTGFQTLNGPVKDTRSWTDTTYRVVANWHPNDTTLLYVSVTSGYKPGGYGSFTITQTGDIAEYGLYIAVPGDKPTSFGPETVTSFDVGYRGTIADGRAQVSISAFFYDYKDLQAIFYEGPKVIVDNIGQVDGMGVEMDINAALTDNLTVRFGMSWFDSEAVDIQPFCAEGELITGDPNVCEGNSIPWAPEWTAFVVLKASFPVKGGEVFGNLAWTWEDDTRVGWPSESIIFQKLDGINQTDIVLVYRTDTWQVSAYVENVFDTLWYDAAYETGDPSVPYVEHTFGPSRPRTAGVRFGYQF